MATQVKAIVGTTLVQSTYTLSGIVIPQNQIDWAALIRALNATIKKMIDPSLRNGQFVQDVTIVSVGDVVIANLNLRHLLRRMLSNNLSTVVFGATIRGNSVNVGNIDAGMSDTSAFTSELRQQTAVYGATGLQSATVVSVGEVELVTPTTPAILPPTSVSLRLNFYALFRLASFTSLA